MARLSRRTVRWTDQIWLGDRRPVRKGIRHVARRSSKQAHPAVSCCGIFCLKEPVSDRGKTAAHGRRYGAITPEA